MSPFKIVACNGHSELACLIAKNLGISLSKTSIISLPNGELLASIGESFRDQDVYIIQSSHGRVNDLLMELLIMISGCKSASARRITAGTTSGLLSIFNLCSYSMLSICETG
jgi:ribose-phosphate pyrophosphokinase